MSTPRELLARQLLEQGQLEQAAALLDEAARQDRARYLPLLRETLDRLEIKLAGVAFRYIPAATVTLGDDVGEDDERPAHAVQLDAFWLAATPVLFDQVEALFNTKLVNARSDLVSSQEAMRFRRFDKPGCAFIAVPWGVAAGLSERLRASAAGHDLVGRLPREEEWERAARGCFDGAEHPWGDDPADGTRADFARFGNWTPQPPTGCAPNDYGLYAMAGTVWEWCLDAYLPYPSSSGPAPETFKAAQRVLRGGSFVDDAIAMRCAFRMAASPRSYGPNIGFRPVLVRAPAA